MTSYFTPDELVYLASLTPEERDAIIETTKRRRACIAEHATPELLGYISEHFECHLPAFQKREDGTFDPLDAMRRDAYREVILWLQDETKKHHNPTT